jgi:hypothetical protein
MKQVQIKTTKEMPVNIFRVSKIQNTDHTNSGEAVEQQECSSLVIGK